MPSFISLWDNPDDPLYPEQQEPDTLGAKTYQTPAGITYDSNGSPLPGVTVDVFRTNDESWVGRTVSGPDGRWVVGPISDPSGPFFAVAYLTGAPDVAGTTRNDLTVE